MRVCVFFFLVACDAHNSMTDAGMRALVCVAMRTFEFVCVCVCGAEVNVRDYQTFDRAGITFIYLVKGLAEHSVCLLFSSLNNTLLPHSALIFTPGSCSV